VSENTEKVGGLVAEIAAASSEQAKGIELINGSVTEIDAVTQRNAANAEESASASEEMNAQAEQMKGFISKLVTLVGGSGSQNHAGTAEAEKIDAPMAQITAEILGKNGSGKSIIFSPRCRWNEPNR
jgi:methyl-accepting chemotaxis protein